jgi:hypothetical protein
MRRNWSQSNIEKMRARQGPSCASSATMNTYCTNIPAPHHGRDAQAGQPRHARSDANPGANRLGLVALLLSV